ncbi:MAG TPA: HAMP domain-containing sensor histidine kinase, partial [Cyclobacteriaceae bacterium]|nr:HAMP domain-containing sensor histidine kinase [Cyclobacteriaceae bacterium]
IHDQRMINDELEELVKTKTNELSEALSREREMSELKSRFVSIASHEFRTPLSVVLSSVTLIEQYSTANSDERVQKHLNRIRSSVTNLTTILNDFLSLDKLEQGKVEVETRTFNLLEFVKEIIDELRVVRKKGQEVLLTHEGDPKVSLDQSKFRYVLVNLLSNAIKYSPQESLIKVSLGINDGNILTTIQDNGIGIPEEEQKFLFSKFFRAKNTGSIQGTGLGLTIVKRYVELMGGKVSFVSKAGLGTTFTVALKSRDIFD